MPNSDNEITLHGDPISLCLIRHLRGKWILPTPVVVHHAAGMILLDAAASPIDLFLAGLELGRSDALEADSAA